jgi:hypothetical protein
MAPTTAARGWRRRRRALMLELHACLRDTRPGRAIEPSAMAGEVSGPAPRGSRPSGSLEAGLGRGVRDSEALPLLRGSSDGSAAAGARLRAPSATGLWRRLSRFQNHDGAWHPANLQPGHATCKDPAAGGWPGSTPRRPGRPMGCPPAPTANRPMY